MSEELIHDLEKLAERLSGYRKASSPDEWESGYCAGVYEAAEHLQDLLKKHRSSRRVISFRRTVSIEQWTHMWRRSDVYGHLLETAWTSADEQGFRALTEWRFLEPEFFKFVGGEHLKFTGSEYSLATEADAEFVVITVEAEVEDA